MYKRYLLSAVFMCSCVIISYAGDNNRKKKQKTEHTYDVAALFAKLPPAIVLSIAFMAEERMCKKENYTEICDPTGRDYTVNYKSILVPARRVVVGYKEMAPRQPEVIECEKISNYGFSTYVRRILTKHFFIPKGS